MDARQKIDMPPLPARCHVVGGHYPDHTDIVDGYSAEQLREFARVYGVNIIATHAAELAAREAEIARLSERTEIMHAERAHLRATQDRLLAILTGIHVLLNPRDVRHEGKTYHFVNPAANEMLDELSARIRAIPDQIEAALTKQPPKD